MWDLELSTEIMVEFMIGSEDVQRVVADARSLPPARESYLEDDFIMNLLEIVLDYQMHTTAVVRALQHFRNHRWDEIHTLDALDGLFTRLPDDKKATSRWRSTCGGTRCGPAPTNSAIFPSISDT